VVAELGHVVLEEGRDAQSAAFSSAPGVERSYSGVTNSTASDRAIASSIATASGGWSVS
jgi:hypothetical protein